MATEAEIREKLKLFVQKYAKPMQVFEAKVISVNKKEMTCDCKPSESSEFLDVRLKAGIDEITDGIVEFPKVDSTVLIGLIGGSDETAFVIKCSDVEEVVIFGGANGGLIKIEELKTQLDKTNSVVNKIIDAISNGTPIAQDGGVGYQASMKLILLGAKVGDFSKIENEKVKH